MPDPATVVYYDGNWVDVVSFIVGIIYASIKRHQANIPWCSKSIGLHLANGIGLFPMVLLILGVFSKLAVVQLLESSRLTLAVAGVFALLAMLDDSKT